MLSDSAHPALGQRFNDRFAALRAGEGLVEPLNHIPAPLAQERVLVGPFVFAAGGLSQDWTLHVEVDLGIGFV